MKKNILFLIGLCFFVFSCQNKKETEVSTEQVPYEVKYAKVFDVKKYKDYTLVTVNDPWDSTRILQKYVLVEKTSELPSKLPEGTLVRIPLNSVAVYSTIHCAVLRELNSLPIIKAVCEPEYIDEKYVKDGIKNNTIVDLGLASNPNIEKLIMADPEAILASPIEGTPYGTIEKTGIPIIEIPDYMESTPLARAEWVKFYSLFIGKEEIADPLFAGIEKEYNKLKNTVSTVTNRPTVFTDLKYGNSWYIAGGNSFIGNLLKDAGAHYIWKDDESTGATPQAFETVLDEAGEADIWLIKYNQPNELTYKALEKEYKPYSYFKAFKDKNIYVCNTGEIPYYETIVLHPEQILKNFAYIFHPDLFEGYEPVFYSKMKD